MSEQAELLHAPRGDTDSGLSRYLRWLETERGLRFDDWDALWRWSVRDLAGFWSSIWDFGGVRAHAPYERVLDSREMPGTVWFPGARLNYAEHAIGRVEDTDQVALMSHSQTRPAGALTFGQLRDEIARVQAGLRKLGVRRGDRVAAYLPNIEETVIAFLATAGLGAVWASCAPEFGARSVVDRFGQIEPRVLLVVDGYAYGDKHIDRTEEVTHLRTSLPTVQHVIHVSYGGREVEGAIDWASLGTEERPDGPQFEPVAFDHPLYVLFSSGTTGKPKAIVHGHGGILLEHLKNHLLHWDLLPGDRLLWFSTTAWMMWNTLVSALLTRASAVLIDGNPNYPDLNEQWRLAERTRPTLMGASPGFLMSCRREGLQPAKQFDLSSIRQLGAAGSPLPTAGYQWVREQFGSEVLLNVGSGGTEVCTGIVQASRMQPVWAGRMSGPSLGVDAKAFDESGRIVVGELGELVITSPMPSMPLGLWGDENGRRLRETYFDRYPGVWRHGDWIEFSENGSCVITGRSDATLNRGGVRLGTAEFYRVVEELDDIVDSLVVHLEDSEGGNGELILFVTTRDDVPLDDARQRHLRAALKAQLSPRHLPDTITRVTTIPRTRTGKKLELPVKHLLQGKAPRQITDRDDLADSGAFDDFLALGR